MATGETMQIAASKKVAFRPAKELKDAVGQSERRFPATGPLRARPGRYRYRGNFRVFPACAGHLLNAVDLH
jgi:DNA-binding protein